VVKTGQDEIIMRTPEQVCEQERLQARRCQLTSKIRHCR